MPKKTGRRPMAPPAKVPSGIPNAVPAEEPPTITASARPRWLGVTDPAAVAAAVAMNAPPQAPAAIRRPAGPPAMARRGCRIRGGGYAKRTR